MVVYYVDCERVGVGFDLYDVLYYFCWYGEVGVYCYFYFGEYVDFFWFILVFCKCVVWIEVDIGDVMFVGVCFDVYDDVDGYV